MPATVHRTPLTWLMYSVNGVSAFFVYSVGPATPLIAADLDISAQAASLHGTGMAAAMLATGAITPPAVARWGRLGVIVRMMLLMIVGVGVVLVAPSLIVSLLGTFLAGTGGGVAAVAANSTLADAHPDVAPSVLTEANASAGWVGLLAPLLMGIFLQLGLGWRVGLALAIPLCALVAVSVGRLRERGRPDAAGEIAAIVDTEDGLAEVARIEVGALGAGWPHPDAEHPGAGQVDPGRSAQAQAAGPVKETGIPLTMWIVMVAVFAAAGAEFAVNYWGASLLSENTTAATGAVTAAMSAPVAGIAVGRTLGARLALRVPAHTLLAVGWLVALVGFVLFWSGSVLWLAATGMFVVGLGLSVLYPLLLDRAVLLMPDRSDTAIAIAAPFIGVAVGLAPFGLGALAADVGLATAFLVVPLILLLGWVAVLASRPAART